MRSTPDVYTKTQVIAEAFRRWVGPWGGKQKRGAVMANAKARRVKNYLEGNNMPNADKLIDFMAESDEIFMAVLELAGREWIGDITPTELRQFREMQQILEFYSGDIDANSNSKRGGSRRGSSRMAGRQSRSSSESDRPSPGLHKRRTS